jgi:hypothetical protein
LIPISGEVIFDSDFSAGTGGVLQDSGSGTTEITGNNDGISDGTASKDDVLKVENIQRVTPQIRIVDAPENTYRGSNKGSVTFTYYVPTGSAIIGKYWQIGSFRGSAGILSSSGVQIVGGAWTTASLSYDNKKPLSTFLTVTDQEVTDTESATFAEADAGDAYYISKIKAYSYEELGLPLDQTISYSSVTFNGTWAEAKAHAEANGGRLAVLDTQQKIDAANKYLLSLGSWGTHWIGLSDIDTEGSFTWIGGKELTANQWKDGEPNNFGDEDVVEIVDGDTSTGVRGWNDNKTTATRNFYLFETQESKAAYSLRNLSSSYTGNVVEVRRSSDTAKEGFTAAEVTDGTLEAWVSADAPISPIADLNVDITDHTTGDTGTYSFGVNDILVDGATGNDNTGDGSESSPYATIAKGLAEVTSGNTVWVKGGTYAENTVGGYLLVNNLSFAAETTLRAVPSETVVLTNVSGSYIFRTNTTIGNFTFRGITFRNESPVTYSIYLSKDSNNFKIQDCRFEAQGSVTYAIRDNGSVSGSTSTTITNTAFTGAIQGIQALNTVGITLTDNYFQTTESGPTFANLRSGCGGTISITGNRLNGQIGTSGNSFDVAGTSLEISDNRINISDNNQDAISVRGGTSTNPITIDLQDNLIEAQDVGVVFYNYISSGTISGNKIHAGKNQAGSKTGLGIPVDGVTPVTALVQSLTVTNNEVRSDGGHAFLMSLNSANHTITGNKFDASQGGDHACVIKGDGHTLTGNKSLGGTRTAYYLKGATNITTTNHVGVQSVAAGNCIEVSPDDATTPDTVTSDCSTTGSTFIATNGDLYTISPSDLTAANVVFNSNCLIVKDSGSWGSLNGTTVTSLATVRTAWDSYITTNDENSYDTVNGTVSTWYDQSGSDNHAVQTTPENQPKIVEGGNILKDSNNNPEVVFTRDDAQFLTASSSIAFNDVFFKFRRTDATNATNGILSEASSGASPYTYIHHSSQTFSFDGNASDTVNLSFNGQYEENQSTDKAGLVTIDDHLVYLNYTSNPDAISDIGRLFNGSFIYGSFGAGEFIFYNSDQSTKRRAIEENIANHYDISLAAFSRDGTVSTWYDQSGNTNNATQTDPTKQPKIVDAGTYLGEIKFESGLYLDKTGLSLSGPFSTFSVSNANSQHSGALLNFGNFSQQYRSDRSLLLQYGDTNYSSADVYTIGEQNVMSFIFDSTSLGYYNGAEVINDAATGATATQFRDRTAIEANIGETYGITDIPAADDTVNGFVQTWYDQSGEGNDAVQTTAANQPKIVGEVTSGQPHEFLGAIDFDGSGVRLTPSSLLLSTIQNTYTATVSTKRNDSQGYIAQINRSTGNRYYYRGHQVVIGDPAVNISTSTVNDEKVLLSVTANSFGLFIVKQDGSTIGSTSYTGNTGGNDSTIGARNNGADGFDGLIDEILVYDALPSNNEDIETNIANHYGITLS